MSLVTPQPVPLLRYRIQKLINIPVTFHYNSPFELKISPHAHVMHPYNHVPQSENYTTTCVIRCDIVVIVYVTTSQIVISQAGLFILGWYGGGRDTKSKLYTYMCDQVRVNSYCKHEGNISDDFTSSVFFTL